MTGPPRNTRDGGRENAGRRTTRLASCDKRVVTTGQARELRKKHAGKGRAGLEVVHGRAEAVLHHPPCARGIEASDLVQHPGQRCTWPLSSVGISDEG